MEIASPTSYQSMNLPTGSSVDLEETNHDPSYVEPSATQIINIDPLNDDPSNYKAKRQAPTEVQIQLFEKLGIKQPSKHNEGAPMNNDKETDLINEHYNKNY